MTPQKRGITVWAFSLFADDEIISIGNFYLEIPDLITGRLPLPFGIRCMETNKLDFWE